VKCSACGFENLDTAASCMSCGTTLAEVERLPPPEPLSEEDIHELGLDRPLSYEQIEVGEVVSSSFGIYFRNFLPFFTITFIAQAPVAVLNGLVLFGENGDGDPSAFAVTASLVAMGLALLAYPFSTAALTFGVLQSLRDRQPGIGECVAVGLRLMVTVILVAILQWFAIMGGFILLIIPGIIITVALTVSIPAAVEERLGAFKALHRSFELTKGNRWQIFGVLFVIGLINFITQLVGAGIYALSMSTGFAVEILYTTILTGVGATASALLYYQLRSVKESLDLNELASVFD
jgi:hypothetical protein